MKENILVNTAYKKARHLPGCIIYTITTDRILENFQDPYLPETQYVSAPDQ